MRVGQKFGTRYEEDDQTQEPKRRFFIACEGERILRYQEKIPMAGRVSKIKHPILHPTPHRLLPVLFLFL